VYLFFGFCYFGRKVTFDEILSVKHFFDENVLYEYSDNVLIIKAGIS